MKKIIIILFSLFFIGCSHFDYVGIGPIVGRDTQIGALPNHNDENENTSLAGIHSEMGKIKNKIRYGFDLDATNHCYKDTFRVLDLSLFGTYDVIHTKSWQFYIGAGAGLGYSPNISKKYEMVGNRHLLGVFDYRAGFRKTMDFGWLSIEYKNKHWSAPFFDDAGENNDELQVTFSFPLGK